ncbi:MAG TPA: J domain-containing protein [Methanomicrobiales archaeon]|nr:J domain-containing protein [Methanomicrobiales archaeon]
MPQGACRLEGVPGTYYEILGVARGASDREIKQAYRALAMRFHPDICHEEEAGDRFRRIHEAYRVLSDPGERNRYDSLGHEDYTRYAGGSPPPWGSRHTGGFQGFGDAFDSFFRGKSWGPSAEFRPRSPSDILVKVPVTLAEAIRGCEREIEVPYTTRCVSCAGTGSAGGDVRQCPGCGGTGRQGWKEAGGFPDPTSPPCGVCGGKGRVPESPCGECGGWGATQATRRVKVRVPAGIDTGMRILIPGLGEEGDHEVPGGDLYVEATVLPHDMFTRRGNDLETMVHVSPAGAVMGSPVELETLDGRMIRVEIPSGTQHDGTVRIQGEGMRISGRAGDLVVRVRIRLPEKATARERRLYGRLLRIEKEQADAKTGLVVRYLSKVRNRGK